MPAHILRAWNRTHFRQGSRAHFNRGPEKKLDLENKQLIQFFFFFFFWGEVRLLRPPPPWIRHCTSTSHPLETYFKCRYFHHLFMKSQSIEKEAKNSKFQHHSIQIRLILQVEDTSDFLLILSIFICLYVF